MGPNSKKEYLKVVEERYLNAKSRMEKTFILNEICANLNFNRKYAIRWLNRKPSQAKKKGPQPKYIHQKY
jgi:hypothetical protein